jgi:hypothetical protein
VYKLEDLRDESVVGQYNAEELTPVKIKRRTEYQIDKILDTGVRRGIRGHLFGRDYRSRFRQLHHHIQNQAI